MERRPRLGFGYDLHKLSGRADGSSQTLKPLVLGGVPIESDHAPVAHSDGDVLLHALTDAILGALAQPDLGSLFPDSDPRNACRDSRDFLAEADRRMREAGLTIGNIDLTLVMQRPRTSPYKDRICSQIASLLDIRPDQVNLKGKTKEGVDAVGEERAMEAYAAVLLLPAEIR